MRIREIRDSPCRAYYGRVRITSHVFGYFKVDRKNNILVRPRQTGLEMKMQDTVDIDTPAFVRETHGTWFDLPPYAIDVLCARNLHVAGSIHAAEHAVLGLTSMFVMATDVKTEVRS